MNVTRPINSENPLLLVYGTLKSPYGNWKAYLDNKSTNNLGTTAIPASAGFIMYDWGGFPIVQSRSEIMQYLADNKRMNEVPTVPEATPIVCQLYRVTAETLRCIDGLEGHPDWYKRRTHPVRLTVGTNGEATEPAWVYIMPPEGNDDFRGRTDWSDDHVASGCWRPTDACVTYMIDTGMIEENANV